jgi:aspartate kinase
MITTLGRGGTDTTATVLSRCLGADELVLVKDVGGVFTADPHLVPSSEMLQEISTREAYLLSSNGGKILHEKVFKHKNSELNIRIISRGDNLFDTGTIVRGSVPELDVEISDEIIHEVSLVGQNASQSQVVKAAVDRLVSIGGIIHSVEVCECKLSVCFTHDALTALKSLHELVTHHGLKSISLKENLKQITVQGKSLEKAKSRIPELLNNSGVHRLEADSVQITLTVEQSAVEEIKQLL